MIKVLVKDIVEATGGKLVSGDLNSKIIGYTQDSRLCKPGMMYIPLKGENHDGHEFIDNAFSNGASTIITEKRVEYSDKNIILVNDTLVALGDIARYIRIQSKAIVVAITGSVGKTSTKDMIYSVISMKYPTLKNIGNYNNHIGLPFTFLRYNGEKVIIVEMGMNHLNEIDYLTKIALPNIGVITNIGTAHIGELGSRENILKAKLEIVNGLDKHGVLILNTDNDLLNGVKLPGVNIKRYSIDVASDLKADNINLNNEYSEFDLSYLNKTYRVYVPVAGKHFIYNALSAISVGVELGIDIETCIAGIKNFELTSGRADVIDLKDNIKVYDGTYNANFDSMIASLDVLNNYKNRKIAVLGDMLELGEYEEQIHRDVGKYLSTANIDMVLLVGNSVKYIGEELKNTNIKYELFNNNSDLNEYLYNNVIPGDVILIKGSHGLHLNEVVDYLKEAFKA